MLTAMIRLMETLISASMPKVLREFKICRVCLGNIKLPAWAFKVTWTLSDWDIFVCMMGLLWRHHTHLMMVWKSDALWMVNWSWCFKILFILLWWLTWANFSIVNAKNERRDDVFYVCFMLHVVNKKLLLLIIKWFSSWNDAVWCCMVGLRRGGLKQTFQ